MASVTVTFTTVENDEKFKSGKSGANFCSRLPEKVTVTEAMVNYSQTLFDLPTIDRYRAAKANEQAAFFSKQSSRGLVVLTVGHAYLHTLALGAQVDNAKALLQADQVLLNQAIAE